MLRRYTGDPSDYGDVLREEDDLRECPEVYFRAMKSISRHDVLSASFAIIANVAEFEEGRACLEVALERVRIRNRSSALGSDGWCLQHLGMPTMR